MFFYPKIITLVLTSLISDVFLYFRTLRELLYCIELNKMIYVIVKVKYKGHKKGNNKEQRAKVFK